MPQPSESTETPRKRPLLAVNSHGVVLTTTKIDDFGNIYRRDMTIFGFFDIENNSFWTGLVVETQLCASLEIFTVGVVSQLTKFGQAEGMKTTLDIENDGKICSGSQL